MASAECIFAACVQVQYPLLFDTGLSDFVGFESAPVNIRY